jgi:PAS domain S-box-containing protein
MGTLTNPLVEPGRGRRLLWTALATGLVTSLISFTLLLAVFVVRREHLRRMTAQEGLSVARVLAAHARMAGGRASPPALLRQQKALWEEVRSSFPGGYLCVVGPDGVLALHTASPERVGQDVTGNTLDPASSGGPRTVGELLGSGQDFAGRYTTPAGEEQLAAFAPAPGGGLVAVHVPLAAVDAGIRAAILPWLLVGAFLFAVLHPLALALLHRAYRSSQDALLDSERQVRHRLAELEQLYRTAPVGLCLVDPQLRFVRVNERLAAFNGLSAAGHLGRSVREVVPDLAPQIESAYERVFAAGEPVLDVEVRGTTPARPGVARTWVASLYPLRAEDGTVWGAGAAVLEITEREQAREAVAASERRFRALIEDSWDAVALVDARGIVTYVSPSARRIHGFPEEEVIGHDAMDWVHPDDAPRLRALLAELVREPGARRHVRYRGRHRDGTWRWLEGHGTNLLHEPAVAAVVCNFRDITERVHAEEELRLYSERLRALSRQLMRAQEAERRRLARELHDELGQVLTAVSLNLQAAKADAAPAALPRLEEAAQTVQLAIGQVRDLSLDLRPPMLDLLGLESALRWYAERQGVRAGFSVRLAGGLEGRLPPDVETALFRVAQEALTNVARHALARRVEVEVRRHDGRVRMLLRDDGVGFDPDSTRVRADRGGSFGLLGMQERVQLLGGRLDLTSAPGQGTSLCVEVPADFAGDGAREGPGDEDDSRAAGR